MKKQKGAYSYGKEKRQLKIKSGQSISGAYGDGILETTRKWNEAQREDKNV